MLVQFGNNWIQKIPLTAKYDSACGLVQFWLSSEFFSSNYFQIGQHLVLLHIQSAKDLGVLLDPHLSYNNHIIKTVSSCMSALGQINRVKHAFDRRTLLMVMNTLVLSKLFYCSNVWVNCSKLNFAKLQSVQNFACRVVSGIRKYDHGTPDLKRLKWLPVSSQLYYRNAILAFKCTF